MIEINNLTKYYHGYRAVEFLDYTFNSNRIGVYGDEKSGKSTILRLISGIEQPTEGEILVNGKIADINKNTYFTFRDGGLIKNKTIKDNLVYPLKLRDESNIEQKVDNLINQFDLTRVKDKKPKMLTFEERARVILAKICLRKTDMLLIDNPFENLDNETREQYFKWFLDIIKDYTGIVVYTTNVKAELDKFDEVILLNYGFVKGYGKLASIVNNPQNLFAYSFLEDTMLFNGYLYYENDKLVFKDKDNKITINDSIKERVLMQFLPTECILSVKKSKLKTSSETKEDITLLSLDNSEDIWLFDWNENSLIK